MTVHRVPRIGRILDGIGILLFLAGAGLFARAWIGFQEVRAYVPGPDAPLWAATELANGYWRMQRVGGALMAAGVAVFVVAWWVARRVRRGIPAA